MYHTALAGEYPCQVFAAANSHIPEIGAIQDWDNVAITFTFTSGSLATVDLARFACYGYDQRLEVFGPGGMLEVKNEPANNTGKYSLISNLLSPLFIISCPATLQTNPFF